MAKTITKLPDAPSASRPASFNQDADKFVGALPKFVDEANALAAEAEANAQKIGDAKADADRAEADADRAEAAKTAAVSAADQAVSCAGAIEVAKNALADASSTLNEMKNIVNTGFIDDGSVNENRSYSSKKIEDTFFKKTGEMTVEKLKLKGEVGDDVLAENSTVLFSENGSELVRKASVSKLKELVQTEVDLSEYIKKTDADTNYLGASATASDSEKLGGVEAKDYLTKTVADSTYSLKGEAPGQGAVQISGQELNLDQSGTNFIVNGNFYLDIVASDSSVGKSGHIALLNMTENFSFGGDCIVHGIRPKGSDVLLSYFVQSPTKIYLSYLPENSNAVSEELVETTNGVKTVVLPKTATEIPPGIYSQKLLRSQIIEGANIKKLYHNQFNGHNTITSISFPALKETEVHCFYNCPNLSSVFVPSIEKIKTGAFSQIGAKELFLPKLKTIEQNGSCLKENPHLETLVIPNATFAVYNHIGYSCPNLKKVVCKRGMADVIKQTLYNLNQSYMINRIEFVEM